MPTENFTVKGSPKTVAHKALGLIKGARPPRFKLKESAITQQGDDFVVSARWEEQGAIFAGSADLRVEAQRAEGGSTQVVITTQGDSSLSVAARLRKAL